MKRSLTFLAVLLAFLAGGLAWYVHSKQPQREGQVTLAHLQSPVTVRYDERGVPHIQAGNQNDLYRALGYVQAQDRLFQMEMLRRLARGELAEVLGPKLVPTDTLFRTLRIREHADAWVARQDRSTPVSQALEAYLDGINQYQDTHPSPLEFDVLGIRKRPFTAEDTLSVGGYLAYSFAAALRTEPLLSYMREHLDAEALAVFDLDWHPQGMLESTPASARIDWKGLGALAGLSLRTVQDLGLPQLEGSNAWAVSGQRTRSGKPLLAGDPHIGFSVPAVWYEAHLSAPGFELYGHHMALNPFALLGHNRDFGWSLTMFQNDDMDLIAEKVNPQNPDQVWHHGQWVDMAVREERISVKGGPMVTLKLRSSPHGPIVNDALSAPGSTPIAMWWAFLETENPILQGFYQVNRADTLEKMREAVQSIHAPGLNLVWANARGDIGWWAAAKLPRRAEGANPAFILDGSTGEADKDGFYPFSANPQEENPGRGYTVSANFQPLSPLGIEIPGYYNPPERGQQLFRQLADDAVKWDVENSKALQLGTATDYAGKVLDPLLPVLTQSVSDTRQQGLLKRLTEWDRQYPLESVGATLFNQFLYELARQAFHDDLGDDYFDALTGNRLIDSALPRLAANPDSPWWKGDRAGKVAAAWEATASHLSGALGDDANAWTWGKAHTLTHKHPLGRQQPLDLVFDVGPFPAPGSHEVPNNQSARIGPAPWSVNYGPSTRRIIDLGDPAHSVGINPVGQSGVPFDTHYQDQAKDYIEGRYRPQWLDEADIAGHTKGTLRLVP